MFKRTDFFTKTILENNNNFNILFIQELLWLIIHNILNFISKEGEDIIKASNYLSWTMFTRTLHIENNHSKVLTYVNIKLTKLLLSLKRIFNHKDINLISFFNCSIMCFIINVYLDN